MTCQNPDTAGITDTKHDLCMWFKINNNQNLLSITNFAEIVIILTKEELV